MRIKHTDKELRAIISAHWKQKAGHIFKKYFLCSLHNKFCDDCKESAVCERIGKKPWVGKI
jgi:hypothetical protein